jgi:hypothetical protein
MLRSHSRKLAALLVCMVCVILSPIVALERDEGHLMFDRDGAKRQVLSVASRTILNRYTLNGYKTIPVIAAAKRGKVTVVAKLLKQMGGMTEFVAEDVDYLRGGIPTERAKEFAADENIIDIDFGKQTNFAGLEIGSNEFPDADRDYHKPLNVQVRLDQTPEARSRGAIPLEQLTPVNSILPTGLIGAPQFVRDHPSYDGRGVTIAVLEGVGDLGHPMLQFAKLLDGSAATKVIDILDPRTEPMIVDGDGISHLRDGFVPLEVVNTDREGRFTVKNRVYAAPEAGHYRFGIYIDLRNAWKTPVAILWNEQKNLVWVDANGDSDFRDQTGIRSFSERQDIVAIRAAWPDDVWLAVKTDPRSHSLRVYFSNWSHTTAVASIAAGTSFMGSRATGTAPASRIIYVIPSEDSEVESMLVAARDPRVDVITCSFGGDLGSSVDGVQSLVLDRIIERYQKPIFIADGDGGPLAASSIQNSAVHGAIAIGTYSDQATEANHEWRSYQNDESEYVNSFSDSGPSGLGELKPDLLVPSLTAFATPCRLKDNDSFFRSGLCEGVGDGAASYAAPMAAGAAALLVSGAKQEGIPYDSDRIKHALIASAHHLKDWPIDRQGGGLIQVEAAWNELVKFAKSAPPKILSAAKITTTDVSSNRTPGYGVSIFDWEGWHAGDNRERILFLYRTNGSPSALKYQIKWVGNDGTFDAADDVVLPLRKATEIRIRVHPKESGLHACILQLIDNDMHDVASQYGIYIVAAKPLNQDNGFTDTSTGVITRNRSSSVYLDIPQNCLLVELSLHLDSGAARFRPFRPEWLETMVGLYPTALAERFWTDDPPYPNDTIISTMLLPNPTPGVWQFLLDDGVVLDHEIKETRYTLTADAVVNRTNIVELAKDRKLDSKNLNGLLYETPITVTQGSTSFYRFDVLDQIAELTIKLERARSETVPELYLYRCIGKRCVLWTHKCGAEQRLVTVKDPTPGTWVVAAENILDHDRSESKLYILQSESQLMPRDSLVPKTTVQFPHSINRIEPCAFTLVNVTEYFDTQAELREIVSPLNNVQYHWTTFRPAPLVQEVKARAEETCGRN